MYSSFQFKSDLKKAPIPSESPKGSYGKVLLNRRVSLLSPEGRSHFGKKYSDVTGSTLPTFEGLRQRAGLMLYETTVNDTNATLEIKMPRDRVYVFVDEVSTSNYAKTYLNSMNLLTNVLCLAGILWINKSNDEYT